MRDDPDHSPTYREAFDCTCCRIERFWIEGAEALVNEQAVEHRGAGGALHLLAQLQGQCQGCEEGFAAAQRIGTAYLAGVVVIDDLERLVLPLEAIALREIP